MYSYIDNYINVHTEKRMRNSPARTKAYKAYSKLTNMLFPFYPDEPTTEEAHTNTAKTNTKIKGT
jgi:hypothetical protein